jgi:ribosomal protein S7
MPAIARSKCYSLLMNAIYLFVPKDVNYALANLHSYAREANNITMSQPDQNELVMAQKQQEQQAILMEDDLVDDENDEW